MGCAFRIPSFSFVCPEEPSATKFNTAGLAALHKLAADQPCQPKETCAEQEQGTWLGGENLQFRDGFVIGVIIAQVIFIRHPQDRRPSGREDPNLEFVSVRQSQRQPLVVKIRGCQRDFLVVTPVISSAGLTKLLRERFAGSQARDCLCYSAGSVWRKRNRASSGRYYPAGYSEGQRQSCLLASGRSDC